MKNIDELIEYLPTWNDDDKKRDVLARHVLNITITDKYVSKMNHKIKHCIPMMCRLMESFTPTDKISTQMLRKRTEMLDIRTFKTIPEFAGSLPIKSSPGSKDILLSRIE